MAHTSVSSRTHPSASGELPGADRVETALWRSIALFRVGALLYAWVSAWFHQEYFARPGLALVVLGLMSMWSIPAALLPLRASLRRGSASTPGKRERGVSRGFLALLIADLLITMLLLISSRWVLSPEALTSGIPTLTVSWAASPVLAWAAWRGAGTGLVAGALIGLADVLERGMLMQSTLNNIVLLLLVGGVGGKVCTLARRAELDHAGAVALESARQERERLAREVHDGVLQALTLIGRGDCEHAELAGEQERALRALVSRTSAAPAAAAELDVRELLTTRAEVSISGPAEPVLLSATRARELAGAANEAINNALVHGGGAAWVLLEDEGERILLSVSDHGPGIPEGRIEQAETEGRLGLGSSIRGRIETLGGELRIHTGPTTGTEIEMEIPRT